MTADLFRTAARFPKVPTVDEVPEDERAQYAYHAVRTASFETLPQLVDGRPYGVPHFEALLVSPPVAAAISGPQGLGRAVGKYEGQPGHHTHADHEMIDMVLAFDSGYWALIAGHTGWALVAGVRVECLEALASGHEEQLTADEAQLVEFIRAVRDGGVTDPMWFAMKDRFGSDRAVIDYLSFVLTLLFHHRFCWAVGAPEMTREDWWQLIADFKSGKRTLADFDAEHDLLRQAR